MNANGRVWKWIAGGAIVALTTVGGHAGVAWATRWTDGVKGVEARERTQAEKVTTLEACVKTLERDLVDIKDGQRVTDAKLDAIHDLLKESKK